MRLARVIITTVFLVVGCGGSGGLNGDAATAPAVSCSSATARVAALCPQVPLQDACSSPRPDCTARCMGEVQSCSEVFCSFCLNCDCAQDRFGACYQQCVAPDAGSP